MYFHFEDRKAQYDIRFGTGLSSAPHIHNHLELVYFLDGKSLCYADSRNAVAEKGDVFISFPNQIHHYHDEQKPNHLILIFSPEICPEFGTLLKASVLENPVIRIDDKHEQIENIFKDLYARSKEPHKFEDSYTRGSILTLLSILFEKSNFAESSPYDSNILKEIITYCYDNFSKDISLQSISDELHISKYYISHLFNNRIKVGFNDYVNSIRIKNATDMLKQDKMTITEISMAVGFNSPRTFNRCFKQRRKITPTEYRNNAFKQKELEMNK